MHMHTTAVQLTLPHAPRGSVAQHDRTPLSWACFPSTTQLTQVTVELMTPDQGHHSNSEGHRVCSATHMNATAVSWSVQSTLVHLQGRDAVPASTFLWHVPLAVAVTVDPYLLQVTARSINDDVATARSPPFCVTEYHPTYRLERFIIGVMLLAIACACHGVSRLESSDATTRPTQHRRTPPVVTSPIALVAPRPPVACSPQHHIVATADEDGDTKKKGRPNTDQEEIKL